LVFAVALVDYPGLDVVEYFAGMQAIARAMRASGMAVFAYERNSDSLYQDILTPTSPLCMRSAIMHAAACYQTHETLCASMWTRMADGGAQEGQP